jgi:hypothetical protein
MMGGPGMYAVKFLAVAAVVLVAGMVAGMGAAAAEDVPLPRERPADGGQASEEPPEAPSPCQIGLSEIAAIKPLPPITGPGECTATDVVELDAVMLRDKQRVAVTPPATLRCPMAAAIANWLRDDVVPSVATVGAALRGVENYDSFECRGRNRVPGAKISEHGRANALDIRSLKLANGKSIVLTDVKVDKSLREDLRKSACARFSTILGPGSDGYHEEHIHFDLIARRNNYKICEWDVLDAAELAARTAARAAAKAAAVAARAAAVSEIPLPRPRPVVNTVAHEPPRQPRKIHRY